MAVSSFVRLGEVAREVNVRAGDGHDLPVYSVTKHAGFVPSLEFFKKQVFSRDTSNYKKVRRSEFAYATIHLDEGSLGLLTDADAVAISPMYTVFAVDESQVHAPYLLAVLKTPYSLTEYAVLGRGSVHRRKAIPFERLAELRIPLPSLSEQRRIADILDRAATIRRKRREAVALTEELLRSTFLEIVGDPVTNPKGWPMHSLSDLCESKQYGTPEKANSEQHGVPVLRMNNLTHNGDIDLDDLKWVPLSSNEISKLDLRDGDVLFNRVNSHELVGKTAVWHHGSGYTFAGYLIRLRFHSDLVTGDYVSAAMNMPSTKRALMAIAKPSINMANISGSDLRRIRLAVPPMHIQQRHGALRQCVESLRDRYRSAERNMDLLFNSIVHRVFRGDLAGVPGAAQRQLQLFEDTGVK